MKNQIKNCSILTFFALSSIAFQANNVRAYSGYSDVAVDSQGSSLITRSGDCVRTKWTTDKNRCCCKCTPNVPAATEIEMPAKVKATKVVIPYDGKIYFDFAKAHIKDSEKPKLDEIAGVLKAHEVEHLHIYGFTDRIGSDKYNKVLSEKRALAVFDYLKTKTEKLKSYSTEIDMKGFGKTNQVKDCKDLPNKSATIECLAPNRRVEVTVEYLDTIR